MSTEQPLQKVRDYIQKYGIEEKLSEAVNQCIKLESTNPYKVISDYLKQYAEEDDDYDDEDEEVMDEEEERRMMAARGGATGGGQAKRQQVAAASFEVPADWKPPVYDKPEADQKFLRETMATNKLMKLLAPSDREQLMYAFQLKEFADGAVIIKQGEEGKTFYILNNGLADISITGKGTVMTAEKGVAFGELALLHNAPRAATVTAKGTVSAWELDIISFKTILMGKSQTDTSEIVEVLKEVPLIQKAKLSEGTIMELAGNLREVAYEEGKNIVVQGEPGNDFFIIRDGEVKCTKGGQEVSERLVKGNFFGELALLSADVRAATVTATKPTSVLVIGREAFTRMFGNMQSVINETSGGYAK